jgi:hypothetical protein
MLGCVHTYTVQIYIKLNIFITTHLNCAHCPVVQDAKKWTCKEKVVLFLSSGMGWGGTHPFGLIKWDSVFFFSVFGLEQWSVFPNTCVIFVTGSVSCVASNSYVVDPTERKNNAQTALQLLCESSVLSPHLKELLVAKWVVSCVWHFYKFITYRKCFYFIPQMVLDT